MAELEKAFKELDINWDGKISKDELLKGDKKIFGETAEEEVERVFQIADADGSGELEFTEFVVASMNKHKFLTDEKLKAAFEMFDLDGSGNILSSELKEVLGVGKNISESLWDKLMAEADDNDSGSIDFDEFKRMMEKIFSESTSDN